MKAIGMLEHLGGSLAVELARGGGCWSNWEGALPGWILAQLIFCQSSWALLPPLKAGRC
jgi:hypothetical protein